CQRSTAESGPMLPRRDYARCPLRHSDESQRDTASQRLGRCRDIRHHQGIEHLVGEVRPWASDAALDFIEDEQCVVLICQLASCSDVFIRQRMNSAFALHQLQYNSGSIVSDHLLQSTNIITNDEARAREHRLEIGPVLFLTGNRERTERASMERIE